MCSLNFFCYLNRKNFRKILAKILTTGPWLYTPLYVGETSRPRLGSLELSPNNFENSMSAGDPDPHP